ncbi:MAG: hypothetical protein HY669_01095 [Chloroflexi bacterium]|nr:hypothetical protein [Chloroflexota bacterium]
MAEQSRRRGRGIPSAAVILIMLGLVFLFNNLGLLPWSLWGTLWRLWPLILIIVGLNILLSGVNPWLALGLTIVIILVAVAVSAYLGLGSRSQSMVTSFSEPLAGASNAQVEANFGAGSLLIDSLTETSDSLATGEAVQPGGQLAAQVSRDASSAVLKVSGRLGGWWGRDGGQGTWRLHLSPRIPLALTLKIGAANASMDLSRLRVNRLRLDVGASNIALTLPSRAGSIEAVVKAGAASVNITVPQGVAARVQGQVGLGSFSIDQARFPKSGDYFVSPDYERAVNRVDIRVESGLASVTIH